MQNLTNVNMNGNTKASCSAAKHSHAIQSCTMLVIQLKCNTLVVIRNTKQEKSNRIWQDGGNLENGHLWAFPEAKETHPQKAWSGSNWSCFFHYGIWQDGHYIIRIIWCYYIITELYENNLMTSKQKNQPLMTKTPVAV